MRAEVRDSLEFLYADSEVGAKPQRSLAVDVARGGTASVHLLLNDLRAGEAAKLSVRLKGRTVREAEWFRLIDVPVERNTGPVGFVEKEGERNEFVARRAPFRVCDAIQPVSPPVRATGTTLALRLQVPIARDARPGAREYVIEVQAGPEREEFAFTVNVHKPVIPPVGSASLPYTNWFSLAHMADRHGLKPWSPGHWRMVRRYADLMVHGRQNTFELPLNVIFQVKGKRVLLDRERLRQVVRTFTQAGMHTIEGGHFASRTGGRWEATTLDTTLTRTHAISPEGHEEVAQVGRQLMEEIDRQGWRGRWVQHVADEPTEGIAAEYRMLVGMVRKYMPGVPILDATMEQGIVGTVDIWCPQVQEYQKHREWFAGRQAAGDRVWFYTCCFPGGPWLNRLLDMELLRPALFGWGAAVFGLEGFLHWGLNHYGRGQDPFQQSVVGHGGTNFLPAGDTHIVYPGASGPWSSLRLEAQREGFEDYELLRALGERDKGLASRIARKALRRFDSYTKDVKVFRAARRALLEATAG
jgi:hypothetical protein